MLSVARRLYHYRALLATLTGRELTARYRGSVLGWAWSLANPVILLLVYTFVFTYVFDSRGVGVDPYALFLVTGLMPWIWIQGSLLEGSGALLANSALIRKATFPSELLAFVPTLANLVHFLLTVPVVAAAIVAARLMGYEVSGPAALLLPVIVLLHLPMIAGLSIGLAALNTHFKDVKDLLANALTVLFFTTPILYTLDMIGGHPALVRLVAWNPMSPHIRAYQAVLFHGTVPGPALWLAMVVTSLLAWTAGTWLFERLRDTLAEAV